MSDPAGGGGDAGGDGWIDASTSGGDEFADARVQEPCTAVDLVFVIDDSGSMLEEQDNLGKNFPRFAQLLENYRNSAGEPIDYRVGVTTSTRDHTYVDDRPIIGPVTFTVDGPNGALLQKCGMTRRWLERGDPGLASTFACLADVGTNNNRVEMPLLAANWALDDRIEDGTNAGFLREDALLALVILTDEDDCSREDDNFTLVNGSDECMNPPWPELVSIPEYLSRFDAIKGGRGRWAAAIIAGETACSSQFGEAIGATRLKQFASGAGEYGVFSSICAGDLTVALEDALDTFTAACEAIPPVL